MRRRIFLGLAPLFLLILAMGLYAVVLFFKLGSSVDVILRENFRSVLAGQEMKEAAERMDSALIFALSGEAERGRQIYAQNQPAFDRALKAELANVTLPGEGPLAEELRQLNDQYQQRAAVFWQTSDARSRHAMYFDEMLPAFTKIKEAAHRIVTINQDNMVAANREARELSARSTRYMIIASLLGLAGAAFFAFRLQKSILRPIESLTSASEALGEGRLDQFVPVASRDELGRLAEAFNKMAARLRAYRQSTSDQIMQARQMTEDTFAAFPDPIFVLTPNHVLNAMNPAAHTLMHKLGSVVRLPATVLQQAEKVLAGDVDHLPTSFEKAVILRLEDKEIFLLPRIIGMREESGHVFGSAIILQDVTRLRLLDDVKSNLVSTVSHELKTPLTSVRMGLHLLLEERIGALNPKQTELLLAAREDSERLLGMINDLLDLARLEGDSGHLHRQPTTVADLLRAMRQEHDALAETRGLHLVTQIEPNLPPLTVDASQIGHVFSNLVSNAVKHSRRGEEIIVSARRLEGKIRFAVKDHGHGIPEEHQSRLFDRFFRVPGENSGGAGLGLAIAREIVTAHGGSVGVSSSPGEGAEFYFDLPISAPAPKD